MKFHNSLIYFQEVSLHRLQTASSVVLELPRARTWKLSNSAFLRVHKNQRDIPYRFHCGFQRARFIIVIGFCLFTLCCFKYTKNLTKIALYHFYVALHVLRRTYCRCVELIFYTNMSATGDGKGLATNNLAVSRKHQLTLKYV